MYTPKDDWNRIIFNITEGMREMLNRSPIISSVWEKPASINYVTGADTLSDTASSQSYFQPINSGEPKAPPGHYFPFFITVIVPYKLIKMKHAVGCKKSSYQTTGDEKKGLSLLIKPNK